MKKALVLTGALALTASTASAGILDKLEAGGHITAVPLQDLRDARLDIVPSQPNRIDGKPSFGVAGWLGYDMSSWLTLAFAPEFQIGIKPDLEGNEAKWNMLNLGLTAQFHGPINKSMDFIGNLGLGHSMLMGSEEGTDAKGFYTTVGAGVRYHLNERLGIEFTLGYLSGNQQLEGFDDVEYAQEFAPKQLHLRLGAVYRLK